MKKMYRELKDKGLEVVGITQYYGYYKSENVQKRDMPKDTEFGKLKDYIEEWELPWPMVVGGKENFEAYGVGGIPQYVIIGRTGKVDSIDIGFSEELHKKFRAKVEKALTQQAAAR
jgi:hypothetical protein